ncbi:MAG: 7-cyano-7-deazaguanine synthase, partial [Clostridia bacterium]|nr:7-cyano-7-deazaguanine synthase [Clostridia bacterium]
MSQHKHICAAMSGGVDSSVVAALLLDAGHAVTGATMVLHEENMVENTDVSDARAVCDRLGIPHRVYDIRAA